MGRRIQLDADDLEWDERTKTERPGRDMRCPSGKLRYRSASKAANVAKTMRFRHKDPFIESYPCKHCSGFHVGHQRGTQRLRSDLEKVSQE